MNFTVFDFETANNNHAPCSIGITLIENSKITRSFELLINPEEKFDPFNINIHKITPQIVKNELNFPKIWDIIKDYFDNTTIVAHNVQFDTNVLCKALIKYNIPLPNYKTLDTVVLSKKTYLELHRHNLKAVATHLKIDFKHHNAKEDSLVCAKILLDVIKINKVKSYDDFTKIASSSTKDLLNPFKAINPHANKYSKVYGKSFAFTGDLSISRFIIMQQLHNKGAIYHDSVIQTTDFLVLGKLYSLTSKLKKTLNLLDSGTNIEIITKEKLKSFIDFNNFT